MKRRPQPRTRKEQIAEFLRDLELPRELRRKVGLALRDAAMVGAAEERSRTLRILSETLAADGTVRIYLEHAICAHSVLEVLGYEGSDGKKLAVPK